MGWYPQHYVGPYAEVTVKLVPTRRDRCRQPGGRTPKWVWIDERDGWHCQNCGTLGGNSFNDKPTKCKCNIECPNPTEGFCSKCGMAANERFREQPEPQGSAFDIHELTEEALAQVTGEEPPRTEDTTTFTFIPNERRSGDLSFRPKPDSGAYDLSDTNMAKQMDWFRFTFGPELAKVEEHYGNLEIKWGVIFYGG